MPSRKPGSRLIRAAGAVAWRPGPDGEPEVLLVHRVRYDDWSLPKGKTEPGEPLPVTAAREVLEEGGASLALGRRLVSVRYNVAGRPKRVYYWAARVLATDERAVPNGEVDRIQWVPATRAVERVSYAHDHGVLADFARFPAPTVPLILLRHAKAAGKSDWNRGDESRPLDDAGHADAKCLADLLACFAPRVGFAGRPALISSPAARCLQTLGPFAERTGGQLREEPALYIHNQSSGTGRADSVPSIAALLREAIEAGEPAVICAHRENIPELQAAALSVLGPVGFPLPKEWDDPLPTGGFWVLNLALGPMPPPEQAPPLPAPTLPASTAVSASGPASALSAVRRWLHGHSRDRDRDRRHGHQQDLVDAAGGTGTSARGAAPEPGDGPRPAVALVSADRYDLSEA